MEPFEALPSDKRKVMIGRAFFGFAVSLLINESLELIPFSLLVILFQTNPFWTSILSFLVNGEQIHTVEAVGHGGRHWPSVAYFQGRRSDDCACISKTSTSMDWVEK